jgi:hypothetical protein
MGATSHLSLVFALAFVAFQASTRGTVPYAIGDFN